MSSSPSAEIFVIGSVDPTATATRIADVTSLVAGAVGGVVFALEHVGSTALPGALTKGDLDLQLRVARADFAGVVAALSSTTPFALAAGAYVPPDGQSFDVADDHAIPTSVHVTVTGSGSDEQWIYRELLLADAALRAQLDRIKRAFDGRSMHDYRQEKAAFFEKLKGESRFACARALEGYGARVSFPVQWGEMDSYQHVNNVVYFRWFESARMEFFRLIDFTSNTGVGPILASTSCRYRAPLVYPDRVTAGVRIKDVSDDRFTMEFALYSESAAVIAATGEGVIVAYDYEKKQKSKLPPAVLAQLR